MNGLNTLLIDQGFLGFLDKDQGKREKRYRFPMEIVLDNLRERGLPVELASAQKERSGNNYASINGVSFCWVSSESEGGTGSYSWPAAGENADYLIVIHKMKSKYDMYVVKLDEDKKKSLRSEKDKLISPGKWEQGFADHIETTENEAFKALTEIVYNKTMGDGANA